MKELLQRGLAGLGLDDAALPALTQFSALLLEKNRVMNLTAIHSPEGVATLHFLDSLALSQFASFAGKTMVDVGTGAGFPGLPLRLCFPSLQLTLLDSLGKRVDFLQEVCAALDLKNVRCVHGRAEEFAAEERERYDLASSRAVAALPILAELCLPLVKVGGLFLAMKGADSDEEIASAAHAIELLGGKISAVRDYVVPETEVTHRVVLIEKIAETAPKYPRSFAKIKKSPL